LYKNQNSIGNILDDNLEIEDKFRYCEKFGECNPCDLKNKLNKYLNDIDCQVEVRKIE
jgi:hypothetical protein